ISLKVVVVQPLWGDDHVSFVLDDDEEEDEGGEVNIPDTDQSLSSTSMSSASSGSISSIITAYESDFTSSGWLGLRQFDGADGRDGMEAGTRTEDVGHGGGGQDTQEADGDDSDHWSDVISLDDY
ncbi:hypothetical protein B0H12DRAFT_1079101, partial [Mycena haematopus]